VCSKMKDLCWRRGGISSLVVSAALMLFVTAGAAQDFSRYHTYNDMTKILQDAVKAHPDIARMESLGKTLEGRSLWIVEIATASGVPVDQRPGLFIGANFEGDHLIGSELALYTIDYLLKNYASNPDVKKSVDEHVFYIMPRVNPDGAELMFSRLKSCRKTNAAPFDGDHDGRIDEDGPEDLNKDGQISVIRVKDPDGVYIVSPEDSRLMRRADPAKGETGMYKLYWEGVDNDNDGFINEDPPGGVDINRNFQHEYPYYKPDAGWHMVSEVESRAVMDWIIAHRNVAIILTFGESDNLIVAPNSRGQLGPARGVDLFAFADASLAGADKVGVFAGGGFGRFGGMRMMRGFPGQQQQQPSARASRPARAPATTVNAADNSYFKTVSDKYIELTGIKQPPVIRSPQGAFFQYGYFQFGVPSFSTPGWGLPAAESGRARGQGMGMRTAVRSAGGAAQAPQSSSAGIDRLLLDWMDKEGIDGFMNWEMFFHKDLGQTEIGGFKPYAVINPPPAKITDLGNAHAAFALYLATLYADVKIAKTEVINHGGGLFRIKAEIENAGFLPTSLRHGVTSRSVKPTMVQIGVEPEQIVSGNSKTNFFQSLAGSGARQKYEWIIKGNPGDTIELKVVAQKAGSDKTTITLK